MERPGTLQIVDPRERGAWNVSTVEATIRDVSPEGIGARLPVESAPAVKPGWQVKVAVPVWGDDLELSGRIAWVDGQNVGIRLILAVTTRRSRHRYAQWIVKQLRGRVA